MVRRHMVRGIPRSALAASLLALVVVSATARADVRPGGPGGAPVPFTAATTSTLSGPATPAFAWCGTGETPENRLPQSTLPSADTIRIGYAVPADAPDRFGELANGIVSDIEAIDQWWQSQDPTRTPRWDTYAFPGCTATLSDLDLSVFRLAHDSAWYAAPNGYSRVVDEIASHLDASEKAVVFFDGAFDDPLVCGESMAAPRNGGAYGVSVIALRSSCGSDLGAGSYTARIAAHELTHNLGAVPIEGPPDRCVDPRVGGHVCDSETDLMYPYAFAGMQLADAALDIDHDDYYRHSGAWWDVQDSAWLVHLPLRTLTLAVSGPGSVSSTVAGIACAATCPVKLDDRSEVRLDAVSATGAELAGWRGACTGSGSTCTVVLSRDLDVTAVFVPRRPRLRVAIAGRGAVTSTPAGIACPTRCAAPYDRGIVVTLHAHAAPNWRLRSWTMKGCGHRIVCRVTATSDAAVRVDFVRARR